jgi:transcriptional regulator with XRE-family HTH domain
MSARGARSTRSHHSGEYQRFLVRLRNARERAKMTQAQVAQRLECPQSYVSKCESGERRVDIIELAQFARLYHQPISFFIP